MGQIIIVIVVVETLSVAAVVVDEVNSFLLWHMQAAS